MAVTPRQTPDQIRSSLATLGDERDRLRRRQRALREEIREAILDADDADLSVIEISQLVGMTRRAVYDLIYEGEGE